MCLKVVGNVVHGNSDVASAGLHAGLAAYYVADLTRI